VDRTSRRGERAHIVFVIDIASDTDKLVYSYRRRILRSPCLHRVSLCTKGRWRRHGADDYSNDGLQHERMRDTSPL
jgi:hypothetical protein